LPAVLFLALNWLGDRMDGTVTRVRSRRPSSYRSGSSGPPSCAYCLRRRRDRSYRPGTDDARVSHPPHYLSLSRRASAVKWRWLRFSAVGALGVAFRRVYRFQKHIHRFRLGAACVVVSGWHPARRLAIAALRIPAQAPAGRPWRAPPIGRRLPICPA
jgi:hypothetical protein